MEDMIFQGLRLPKDLKESIENLAKNKYSNSSQIMREALAIGIKMLEMQKKELKRK